MNIIAKLTLRHLRENRKRTAVTILGIAMATALISAILLGVFSFFKFFGYIAVQTSGDVQAAFSEVTKEQAERIRTDERVVVAGVIDTDPLISGVRLDSGKEDRFRIGNIAHGDRGYFEEMVLPGYEGTLPADASEIAVEEQFLSDNGLSLKIGDTLSFEQGNRHYYDENGKLVYLAGSYRSDEAFEAVSDETCTVTAILHRNRPTTGYDILRGMDEGSFPAQKYAEVRIQLKNCDHTAIRQIRQIVEAYGIRKYALNTEYLLSVFAFEDSAGAYRSFFVIMAIALAIVIVTSVVLIVNSIGMSLAERMRYLGMLASVGATGRQKRFSIFFEGFVLGAVGIPLGMLLGYIGTRITLNVLGRRVLEADILAGAEGMRGTIPVSCSAWVLLAIVVCAAVTILISTLVPAVKAARIMPVDALRQSDTIRVKGRRLKVSPLIRRIFGYEGELAYKNIKRNGIKGTVITVSIAMSVILFLTISFFCDSVERLNQYDFDLPCQLVVSCALEESGQLREEIRSMDGVEKVFSGGMIQYLFEKKENEEYTLANKDIADPAFLTPAYSKLHVDSMALVVIDDEDFRHILEANRLPEDKYFGGQLRGVLMNSYYHETRSKEVFNNGIIGQSLHYDEKEGNPPAVEIGDLIPYDEDNYVFKMTPRGALTAFAPASVYYEKAKETIPAEILTCDLCIITPEHAKVYEQIYDLLEREGYHNYSIADMTDTLETMNTVTLMLKTAMYGFTILLTLIAAANINNTISTGVLLRRREFAMYRSVGMAAAGFGKMIRLETFLYGIRALAVGIPVSLLLSWLMYRSFDSKLYSFDVDWPTYILVTAAVFAVVGVSMLLSVSKLKDDSIIEALKTEMV
ncbi:MAG: ABC transporter permease [Lachnospiraceae bacterium]|nr:ABC transporter permease [Lachnospiraceae bacterium]